MGKALNLRKKKDQMKAKLALIKLLSDPKHEIHQISVYPSINGLNDVSFSYRKNYDNKSNKK